MATESTPQTTEPSRQRTPSRHAVAVIAGWFVGWPVFLRICFDPTAPPADARQACLIVAGSLLWFLSSYRICVFGWRRQISPMKITVGWLFGWPALLLVCVHLGALIEHPSWLDGSFIFLSASLWLVGCYGIYDMWFTKAEKRWPGAKQIREMIGLLAKAFVRSHHNAP
jgi:hypothetical protein